MQDEDLKIPFGKLYLYNSIAIGISTVTPFQSGEALKVERLGRYGSHRLSGYAIFFLERLFDLLTVLALAATGTVFGFNFGIDPFYLYLAEAVLIFCLAGAIKAIFLLPFEILQTLKIWINKTWQQKKRLSTALVLTILAWMTIILGWQFALAFFGINIAFYNQLQW